jgi:hypothetical protein
MPAGSELIAQNPNEPGSQWSAVIVAFQLTAALLPEHRIMPFIGVLEGPRRQHYFDTESRTTAVQSTLVSAVRAARIGYSAVSIGKIRETEPNAHSASDDPPSEVEPSRLPPA